MCNLKIRHSQASKLHSHSRLRYETTIVHLSKSPSAVVQDTRTCSCNFGCAGSKSIQAGQFICRMTMVASKFSGNLNLLGNLNRWSAFLLGSYACSRLAQAGPLACREAAATANLLADKLRQITFECQSVQASMRQRQWSSFNG